MICICNVIASMTDFGALRGIDYYQSHQSMDSTFVWFPVTKENGGDFTTKVGNKLPACQSLAN